MAKVKGLRERLDDGESVICAEGYMWELERRGFVKCGAFTPEVVIDYPERVIALHDEFVMAGTDVVEAYTYYGNRAKLRSVGREDDLEKVNMNSLKIARGMADKYGLLMAGNICNTTTFTPDDEASAKETVEIFKEQVLWAVAGGADYMIGETFSDFQEAKIALEVIKKHGNGMPAVITLAAYSPDITTDDIPFPEALRKLEELGADVVGLNCGRGPATMLPLLRKCRKVCKGPLAALPVPFRTTEEEVSFQSLTDPLTGEGLFPLDLSCRQCSRSDIKKFAQEAKEIGIQYIGLCCGASSNLLREVAVAYGRQPVATKYAPDVGKHSYGAEDVAVSHNKKVWEHMFGKKSKKSPTVR